MNKLELLNDAELVLLIQQGVSDALAETYRRHSGSVFNLVVNLVKSRVLAEEITQEIFVGLWQKPDRFDPLRGSLKTYLLTFAHSKSVDVIRSEQARKNREDKVSKDIALSGLSFDESLENLMLSAQVKEALDGLKEEERQAVKLAYFNGLTQKQIAEMLDTPEGTIKSRIRSAMSKLARSLLPQTREIVR